MLDVDSYYSDLSIIVRGRMVFTRSILVGANQLIPEFEKWREKFGLEVQRSLEACRSEQPGMTILKMVVTGAGVRVKDLAALAGGASAVPVEGRDCLKAVKRMPSSPSLGDPSFQAVSMTAVVGIGLAPESLEFDLIPESVSVRKSLMERARGLTTFGVLVMAILVFLSMWGVSAYYLKKHRLDVLEQECTTMAPEARRVVRMGDVIGVVKDRRDAKWTMLNLLSEAHGVIPPEVELDSLDIDLAEGKIQLDGMCGAMQGVRTLVDSLEQTALYREVKEEGATRQDGSTGKYRFKVVGRLER